MELIVWIIVGGIAGWIASMIVNTDKQMGMLSNIVVGMIGSIVGGAIIILIQGGGLQFSTGFNDFNLVSILVSILGAVILLWIAKALNRGNP